MAYKQISPQVVAEGGTGAITLTDHGILIGSGTSAITAASVGSTGELLVGSSGADPSFGTSADGNFTFTSSTAAATRSLTVTNTDNTSTSSHALLQITSGGASGGDPFATFTVSGVSNWSIGNDNTDSDAFKIAASAALGTTDVIIADTGGDVNIPGNLNIGSRTPSNPYNIAIEATTAGLIGQSIQNLSSNASAGSNLQLIVETGAADSFTYYGVASTTDWSIGIDNSSSDSFKIATGTTPSGTNTWTMTTAGERTMPLQPAFLAYNSADDTNQTGAGTTATVEFDSEIYDQNSDFNTTTDTFTAPVTGRYHFDTNVRFEALTAAMTNAAIFLTTSNRTYRGTSLSPGAVQTSGNGCSFSISTDADMDASDTAIVQVAIFNGAGDTATISGDGTAMITRFSGHLVC